LAKGKMRDLIVLLPGLTGSVLWKDGHDIWGLSGGALWNFLTSLGGSLHSLRLPKHEPSQPAPDDGVRATRIMPDFHGVFGLWKIDGYAATARAIRDNFDVIPGSLEHRHPANFIEFPYDWRRSNRESAARLKAVIDERLPLWREHSHWNDARVILIAHSMGGLVARYYLEVLEGSNWKQCRALITFGTPYWGAVDAINYVANGYKQQLLDLTEVLRSFPSVYELMACYDVVKVGQDWRKVAKVGSIPKVDSKRAAAALAFHDEIDTAVKKHREEADYLNNAYKRFPMIGVRQPTLQSVHLNDGRLVASEGRPGGIDEELAGGDGTVPRSSATPFELFQEYRETFFVERHGSLQNNTQVLDDLVERLKQMQASAPVRGTFAQRDATKRAAISLRLDDLYLFGEPIRIEVALAERPGGGPVVVKVVSDAAAGKSITDEFNASDVGTARDLGELSPGRYRITVASKEGGPSAAPPVHDVFEVAGKE
jgi:pimeloyl-ACP methyl ester carboxylesterase